MSAVAKDEETGLYYYGARYLDPKYSRWMSGDPAVKDYIPTAGKENDKLPNGGVYNSINLHVYNYVNNNPVKYTDPDGHSPKYALNLIKKHWNTIKEMAENMMLILLE